MILSTFHIINTGRRHARSCVINFPSKSKSLFNILILYLFTGGISGILHSVLGGSRGSAGTLSVLPSILGSSSGAVSAILPLILGGRCGSVGALSVIIQTPPVSNQQQEVSSQTQEYNKEEKDKAETSTYICYENEKKNVDGEEKTEATKFVYEKQAQLLLVCLEGKSAAILMGLDVNVKAFGPEWL